MLELIYKDCMLMKKNIIMILLSFLYGPLMMCAVIIASGAAGTALHNNDALVMARTVTELMPVFMIYTTFTSFFSQDENRQWAGFVISSPVTAEGQVREKYLLWLLLAAAGTFLASVSDTFCMLVSGSDVSVSGLVVLFFLICTVITALDMPLMFRFGSQHGSNLRVGFMLGIIAIAGLYFLFGDMSIFGDTDAIIAWFIDLLKNGTESKPLIALIVLLPYIAGLMLYISYRISVRVYTRGVEEYE